MREVEEQLKLTQALAIEVAKQNCAFPYLTSRYLERVENIARVIAYNMQIAEEYEDSWQYEVAVSRFEPMLYALDCVEAFKLFHEEATDQCVFHFLALENDNPNSLVNCIRSASSYASHPQSELPQDAKAYLRGFLETFNEHRNTYPDPSEIDYLVHLARSSTQMIFGMMEGTMKRGRQFDFFELGRSIERADNTARILAAKRFSPLPDEATERKRMSRLQWNAIAHHASATDAIRSRDLANEAEQEKATLQALILSDSFPRSIRFCIAEADRCMRAICEIKDHEFINPPSKVLGRLRAELDYMELDDILNFGVTQFLDDMKKRIQSLHESIESIYFLNQN